VPVCRISNQTDDAPGTNNARLASTHRHPLPKLRTWSASRALPSAPQVATALGPDQNAQRSATIGWRRTPWWFGPKPAQREYRSEAAQHHHHDLNRPGLGAALPCSAAKMAAAMGSAGRRGSYSRKVRQRSQHQPSTRPVSCIAQVFSDSRRRVSREFACRRSGATLLAELERRLDPGTQYLAIMHARNEQGMTSEVLTGVQFAVDREPVSSPEGC
jgi:hypothetical protein